MSRQVHAVRFRARRRVSASVVLAWIGTLMVLLAGFGACASNPLHVMWDEDMVRTKKLARDGNVSNAAPAIDRLAANAPSERNLFEARILRGDLYVRQHKSTTAAHEYLNAAKHAPDESHAVKAIYRLGQLLYDGEQTEEVGLMTLVRIVRTYPNSAWAIRALDTLDVHFGTTASGCLWLEKLYRGLFNEKPRTKVAPHLLYRGAMLHVNGIKNGNLHLAMSLLTYLTEHYPRSALWDNAMYAQANIHHTHGHYSEEIATLRRILLEREPSYILGNYETQFYHRCSWRIAQIYAEFLNQPESAMTELEYFVREFKYSKQYDDALFMLAILQRRSGQLNNSNASLNKLVSDRPNSRLVPRAKSVLLTGHDTGPAPPWSFPGTQNVDVTTPGQ